eukprot:Pompholyxophrys_punicea_v1_NODE_210_length_2732_cov_4.604034.p1 type:complete len:282 gc:universal NODE_210_length_2732_cov_4.604034:1549-704(-)
MKTNFWKDQQRNRPKQRSNKFSLITYRIALAVYYRSPAAYTALRDFEILALPSESSLKKISQRNNLGAGIHESKIADQFRHLQAMQQQHDTIRGKDPILFEGCLIFDEVKVAMGISWSSKDYKISSEATSASDASDLHNVYETLDTCNDLQTSYILQTLWRCITFKFDLIGPYFTNATTLNSEFVLEKVIDVVRALQYFGLKTTILIGDGASANLAAFKTLTRQEGQFKTTYGTNQDPHAVSGCFQNPFCIDDSLLFCLPCLKNMMAALYSSRTEGAKSFL